MIATAIAHHLPILAAPVFNRTQMKRDKRFVSMWDEYPMYGSHFSPMNFNFGSVTFTFLTASFRACIVARTATAGLLPPLISSM